MRTIQPLSGADKALENIIDENGRLLIHIAFHYTGSMPDAEDIAQEAFIRLFSKKKPALDDREAVRAWLIRVTINLCRDLHRSAWQRKTEALTEAAAVAYSPTEDSTLGLVLALPEKYRVVIYLHYYEGYPFQEIARLLKTKEKTVHTWHARAKKLLKEKLMEEPEGIFTERDGVV